MLNTAARWLAATAVALTFVELTTRIDDWARFGVPISSNTTALDELVVSDSTGMHARPNGQFQKFRTNQWGLRGAPLDTVDALRRPLVITSGASETFGLYESVNHEWPRQLEDSLHIVCAQSNILVGNAGFVGMSLPTVVQDLRLRIAPRHPVAVVYYPTPMQYLEEELPHSAPLLATTVTEWKKPFSLRSASRVRGALLRAVPAPLLDRIRQMDTKRSRRGREAIATYPPAERLASFDSGLRSLVGTVRSIGAIPILVVHQNRFAIRTGVSQERWLRAWERFYPLYSGNVIADFDSLAAQRTEQVGRDSSVDVVNPMSRIRQIVPPPFADFSHFTDQGAAMVAGATAHTVARRVCGR